MTTATGTRTPHMTKLTRAYCNLSMALPEPTRYLEPRSPAARRYALRLRAAMQSARVRRVLAQNDPDTLARMVQSLMATVGEA